MAHIGFQGDKKFKKNIDKTCTHVSLALVQKSIFGNFSFYKSLKIRCPIFRKTTISRFLYQNQKKRWGFTSTFSGITIVIYTPLEHDMSLSHYAQIQRNQDIWGASLEKSLDVV